jgi:hypothetical protein
MSNANTTKNATRDARLADARKTADDAALVELGDASNREVTVTSTLATTVKEGTKTRKTSLAATVGLSVSESEEDTAAPATK